MSRKSPFFSFFCISLILFVRMPGIGSLKPAEHHDEACTVFKRPDQHRECPAFDKSELKMILSVFVFILWGAIVQVCLKVTKVGIPYSVVLLITGTLIGLGTRLGKENSKNGCLWWSEYTRIGRMEPEWILYVFLPILIFESAFSMNAHVFTRAAAQILLAAFPGMIIATFLTTFLCRYALPEYKWNFVQASFFASIVSATDPVAVVAILKELGISEILSTMVEGESLLNDGVAIMLFEILEVLVEDPSKVKPDLALMVLEKFCQIALGGFAFGFLMGKITVFLLSRVYHDLVVETSITVASAYLTYYIADDILGVSPILATVLLGLTVKSGRTAISPEVEHMLIHFWEILAFLANTVLFVILGIICTETALNFVQPVDAYYLILLYIVLNFIRLAMLLILSPLLKRIGYGLNWRNMLVISWSGLRGAIGICLSLEVYKNPKLCDKYLIGPKILFQVCALTILSLVINGTLTRPLLIVLGMTKPSSGEIRDMKNALKQVHLVRDRKIGNLKSSTCFTGTNWDFVQKCSTLINPFTKEFLPSPGQIKKIFRIDLNVVGSFDRFLKQPSEDSDKDVRMKMTEEEIEKLEKQSSEDTRLRCLTILKRAFWRHYEEGKLPKSALKILDACASTAQDSPNCIVLAKDLNLKKYCSIRPVASSLKAQLAKIQGSRLLGFLAPISEYFTKWLDRQLHDRLFLAFSLGKGYIAAVDEVMAFLPQVADSTQRKFLSAWGQERMDVARELEFMEKTYPGIAVAVKTRDAVAAVLHKMQGSIEMLKENGLIDEKEYKILVEMIERKTKRLSTCS